MPAMDKRTWHAGNTQSAPKWPVGFGNRRHWLLQPSNFVIVLLLFVQFSQYTNFSITYPWQSVFQGKNERNNDFDWSKIKSSRHLHYTSCFDSYECARLDVPLNWNATNKHGGPRAAIAIIKLPARVPVTDPRYGGAILMNPGGPGESGVHQVLSGGKHVQAIVDPYPGYSDGKYFDIVSFDPRAVNNTTPLLKCFADAVAQHEYINRMQDYGVLWSSPSVLGLEWGQAQALGESCSRKDTSTGLKTVKYVNTAQTVEDMVEILERLGEWREMEGKRLLAARKPSCSTATAEALQRLKWRKGSERIHYWGLSYGTLLGETFAAMHPDRVERMILDGVLNAQDYYSGATMRNLLDSDKIISAYSEYCFRSGPQNCPMYVGTSARDIEARFQEVMMGLKYDPLPLLGGGDSGPAMLTYRDMHLRMLGAMYFSYAKAENFFSLVAGVSARNNTAIKASLLSSTSEAVQLSSECIRDGPFSIACTSEKYESILGPFQAIGCMDSAPNGAADITKEQFMEFANALHNQSRWISPTWAKNKLACVGFKSKPAWTFTGPIQGKPAYPILAIGNTHDTVTPLVNAAEITHLFPSSVVLHHDSEGHCSFSNPSLCTGHYIREYFQTGKVPENGTTCTPEYRPFIGCLNKEKDGQCKRLGKVDKHLWEHMEGLTKVWG